MNISGKLTSYLLSPPSEITYLEPTSQIKLVKNPQSYRPNDLLMNKTKPNTRYHNFLAFCDADKNFKLHGDLLKTILNKNYNLDFAKLSDKKLLFELAMEMFFDEKTSGDKNDRNKSFIRLLQSPSIMASGISTIFLPENPNELCDRSNLLLPEKQAGNNSDIINVEIVAILDEIFENKCISTKQHIFSLLDVRNNWKIRSGSENPKLWLYLLFTCRHFNSKHAYWSNIYRIYLEKIQFSLLKTYVDLKFEVIKKADNSRYANSNDIRLVNLGSVTLFSKFKMTTFSRRHAENFSHAHLVCFLYKLLTSSRGADDLSIGFDRDRGRRQQDKLINKT